MRQANKDIQEFVELLRKRHRKWSLAKWVMLFFAIVLVAIYLAGLKSDLLILFIGIFTAYYVLSNWRGEPVIEAVLGIFELLQNDESIEKSHPKKSDSPLDNRQEKTE